MNGQKILLILAMVVLMLLETSCSIWPLYYHSAYPNDPLISGQNKTNAKKHPSPEDDYFLALALSGGGSRAANFSAAIMWELHKLGILEKVQYISSVSGGSLASTYYALFRNDPQKGTNILSGKIYLKTSNAGLRSIQ